MDMIEIDEPPELCVLSLKSECTFSELTRILNLPHKHDPGLSVPYYYGSDIPGDLLKHFEELNYR
jgi:hypothetical protein